MESPDLKYNVFEFYEHSMNDIFADEMTNYKNDIASISSSNHNHQRDDHYYHDDDNHHQLQYEDQGYRQYHQNHLLYDEECCYQHEADKLLGMRDEQDRLNFEMDNNNGVVTAAKNNNITLNGLATHSSEEVRSR